MSFEQLSPTEQAFAKEHHGLLICFIRTYQLDDDVYGMMSERYLKTVHRYLTNRRLRKYSFSTILWMSLRSELSHMLDQNARTPVLVPIEDDRMPTTEDEAAYHLSLKNLSKLVRIADMTRIIDNSGAEPNLVCEVQNQRVTIWENDQWSKKDILALLAND